MSLGYKVQSVLHQLRLLNEAILPRFNRYTGAPSLGERSDLYILRPTRRSLAAARRQPYGGSIYTQGRSARESAHQHLPEPLLDNLHQRVSAWPKTAASRRISPAVRRPPNVSSPDTVHLFSGTARGRQERARARILGDKPLPRLRTLRAARLPYDKRYAPTPVRTPASPADLFSHPTPLRELVECIFSLQMRRQAGNAAWVELIRQNADSSDRHSALVRSILERRRARLNNAWREALIDTLKADGVTLSKNQARSCIAQTSLCALYAQQYIGESTQHSSCRSRQRRKGQPRRSAKPEHLSVENGIDHPRSVEREPHAPIPDRRLSRSRLL